MKIVDNQRSNRRSRMNAAANFASHSVDRCLCRIADLSRRGAGLKIYSAIDRDGPIELRAPTGQVRRARVMWADELEAGCAFEEPLTEEEMDKLIERFGFTPHPAPVPLPPARPV